MCAAPSLGRRRGASIGIEAGSAWLQFRVVEKIGEGGMGEVWRAVDTTLDREVAIKFLPAAFASDPERLARFEREAKLLASLNHRNIAAIYGLHAERGIKFLSMELVPGDDLAQRLAPGRMNPHEAIEAARQIAAGLEAAHDSGVIHRDLKPANVKRAPDGTIKLLDFGLAKALDSAQGDTQQAPTVTSAGSSAGVVLGTAAYMSPEQARGQSVDRRTDLWAFGCVLYEMLAGKKAYDGETVTDVLAAIVTRDPDWSALPPETSAAVRRLLRRCLEKDPRKRLRDAGDASLLLDDNPEDPRLAGAVEHTARFRRPAAVALILLAAIAGIAAGHWLLPSGGSKPIATDEVRFHQLTFQRGMIQRARFTADGKTIVFGASWANEPIRLHVVRVEGPGSTALAIPDAQIHSVSNGGELAIGLGYAYVDAWMGEGTLARAPLLGGAPREILERVRDAEWSPDASELAIVRRVEGADRLEYPAGKVLYRTTGWIDDARFSPSGDRIAFVDHPVYADDRGDIAVVDRAGAKTTLASGFSSVRGLAWSPSGREIWFTAGYDNTRGALRAVDLAGHAHIVLPSIVPIHLLDVASDGHVLLARESALRGVEALLAGDAAPRRVSIPGEAGMSHWIAPDGRTMLVTDQQSNEYDSFLVRADRPSGVHLGSGDDVGISPDGRWAVGFNADSTRMILTPVGAGEARVVPNVIGLTQYTLASWLPDGKHLVFTALGKDGKQYGFVQSIDGGDPHPFTASGVAPVRWWSFPVSTDGTRIVLARADGAVCVFPIDGGTERPLAGLKREEVPISWTEDGRAVFVVGTGPPWAIDRLDVTTGRRVSWATITTSDPAGVRSATFAMSPNGKYWSVSTARLLTDLFVVDGLR